MKKIFIISLALLTFAQFGFCTKADLLNAIAKRASTTEKTSHRFVPGNKEYLKARAAYIISKKISNDEWQRDSIEHSKKHPDTSHYSIEGEAAEKRIFSSLITIDSSKLRLSVSPELLGKLKNVQQSHSQGTQVESTQSSPYTKILHIVVFSVFVIITLFIIAVPFVFRKQKD